MSSVFDQFIFDGSDPAVKDFSIDRMIHCRDSAQKVGMASSVQPDMHRGLAQRLEPQSAKLGGHRWYGPTPCPVVKPFTDQCIPR